MAIGFDAVSSSTANAATSITFSHTVGSGAYRILIVGVSTAIGLGQSHSGVTYGGVAMTLLVQDFGGGGVSLWYLVNPASGAANVVASIGTADAIVAGAVSYTGADQSLPFRDTAHTFGTGTAISVTCSAVGGDLVIDCFAVANSNPGAASVTVDASQTQRWKATRGPISGAACTGGASEESADGSGSTSMDWTISASKSWAQVAGALRPFVPGCDN